MEKLKEELTTKMHSEFNVSMDTEIRHRAGSLWSVIGFDSDKATMKKWCISYGLTISQAMKYKVYWQKLAEQNKVRKK